MKNTYVSLDMIFIRGDGRILRIAENTEPLSERMVPSGGPVRAVLEVVAGTARKLGIAAGRPGRASDLQRALGRAADSTGLAACWPNAKRVSRAPRPCGA